MNIYSEFIGYGKYSARYDDDLLPYSQAMYERQAACLK
ncbi:hypothetical protein DSC91_003286 [Paraburkholderia caffeinilytica]|nr:hypothetical protein DSC91_003286 [Paraburkholderia caffeinilytica]CAB3803477.1 hypothetical protein LMG28690_05797 [Paraburkholderia caffeinilytica]